MLVLPLLLCCNVLMLTKIAVCLCAVQTASLRSSSSSASLAQQETSDGAWTLKLVVSVVCIDK